MGLVTDAGRSARQRREISPQFGLMVIIVALF
jgi:hypothetical protein